MPAWNNPKCGFQKDHHINLGRKLTQEHKNKLREISIKLGCMPPSWKGKQHSEETKKKIANAHKGIPRSKETKLKIRIGRIGKYRGKNSFFWKGGINDINDTIRKSDEMRKWKKDVFELYKYQCLDCGLYGGWNKELNKKIILNAHHVYPFAFYPRLRFDLNNGQALCKNCHFKRPKNVVSV